MERVYIPDRPGEPKSANIKKIIKDLNWQPKITIEDGVKAVKNISY